MAKIEIAEIRKSAASLQELNEGYILYQNKAFDDFEFEIERIPVLTFKVSANFSLNHVTLSYTHEAKGDCSCQKKGLCQHEICLFFMLRDKLNQIFSDKESEARFFEDAKQDELVQSLMELKIMRSAFTYSLIPTIGLYNDLLTLSLSFNLSNQSFEIKDVYDFLTHLSEKGNISFNDQIYPLDYKYFDKSSIDLINFLFLTVRDNSYQFNHTTISFDFLNFLADSYQGNVYFYNNYAKRHVYFKHELANIKFSLDSNRLYIINNNYQVFDTHSKGYILLNDTFYQYDLNDIMLFKLYEAMVHKNEILLNDNNKEIILNNIYPMYQNLFNLKETLKRKEIKINTYFDYKNYSLSLHYDGDFKDSVFYLKKKNYKLLIRNLGFEKKNNYTINDFDLICEIINHKLELFKEYGDVYLSESIKNAKFYHLNSSKLRFKIKDSMISLSFEGMKYSPDELKDILIAYKNNHKYVELKNGSIIEIDSFSANEYEGLINEIGFDSLKDGKKISLYQAYFLQTRYQDLVESNKLLDDFSHDLIHYQTNEYELDERLNHYLRDYQLHGFRWLKTLEHYKLGGILADDMGLGKTLEIISLISTVYKEKSSIIVAPTSLIFNWENEFKKFSPWISTKVIYGTSRTKEEILNAYNDKKVLITSYEALRSDIDKYKDLEFKIAVIDEAQFIKNPDALKTLACKEINSETRFALTGTPIENSLLDLWSIFDFILPGYLKTRNEFISNYEGFSNPSLLEELNRKTTPFILRRLKCDVLDLEDKIESFAYSIMTEEERKLYDAYLLEVQNELSSDDGTMHVLSLLTRLRELACEPRLFLNDVKAPNSKLDLLMEIIDEKISDDHKILVFSQFTSMFDFMEERLKEKKIKYLKLTGKTDAKDRISLVNEFNTNKDIKVFLISLKAGGTGLNLTSADTVIHYDPWWNIAAMNQATDRAHRLGQEKAVHVIKMINKGTIEEKILELQNQKKELSNNVINETDLISKMTKEEIKELFK